MNNQELNEYIKTVVSFSFDANKYFNDSEPWAVRKKILKEWMQYYSLLWNKLKTLAFY